MLAALVTEFEDYGQQKEADSETGPRLVLMAV